MAQPNLALRTTRNGLFSHYVVAGSKNPPPLGVGSVKSLSQGVGSGAVFTAQKQAGWLMPT